MGALRYTKNCPVSLWDWRFRKIKKVFAGNCCAMALTAEGKVLQKVQDPALQENTDDWKHIKSIAISQHYPALAVGLCADGTCKVTKKALKRYCRDYKNVCEQISSLRGIKEVWVSDAIFALTGFGNVHCIPLDVRSTYELEDWHDIRRIAVGNQCSVFGITKDGKVLSDGANGKHREKCLSELENIVDICALGTDFYQMYFINQDRKMININGEPIPHLQNDSFCSFRCNFRIGMALDRDDRLQTVFVDEMDKKRFKKFENQRFSSIAFGLTEQGNPFGIAVKG